MAIQFQHPSVRAYSGTRKDERESRYEATINYQLLNYLLNVRQGEEKVEGIFLYPTVDQSVRVSYSILGIPLRIQTLDLSQPWRTIHDRHFFKRVGL